MISTFHFKETARIGAKQLATITNEAETAAQKMTHCFTYRGLDWCMLALIGCTWNDYPHWSAPCMPPVVPPPPHPPPPPWPRPCRTSISRMSSKEKICLHEREKHPPPPALQSSPAEDEEEEGQAGQNQSQGQAKASSSSSSEEESESESDAESGERSCFCFEVPAGCVYSSELLLLINPNDLCAHTKKAKEHF